MIHGAKKKGKGRIQNDTQSSTNIIYHNIANQIGIDFVEDQLTTDLDQTNIPTFEYSTAPEDIAQQLHSPFTANTNTRNQTGI